MILQDRSRKSGTGKGPLGRPGMGRRTHEEVRDRSGDPR